MSQGTAQVILRDGYIVVDASQRLANCDCARLFREKFKRDDIACYTDQQVVIQTLCCVLHPSQCVERADILPYGAKVLFPVDTADDKKLTIWQQVVMIFRAFGFKVQALDLRPNASSSNAVTA